ncbi:hypothetical protein VTL71DRAFT_7795 [Oculimacula yallundae]|uniref:Histone acetyltransferase type B catalytic subunit n=1 Tax=Oculimacula yallundae TaxID=86028 RepID=A0ABR4CVZ8_9HELO
MADHTEDWSTEANDALSISLVAPSAVSTKTLHTFHPRMTYSIFGDEERIFGYKDLKINLRYNYSDMRPNLDVTYKKKFPAVGETEATDVKLVLEDYLPKLAFEKPAVFDKAISDPISKDWKPPGELWQTIETGGRKLEVWKGNLADVAVQQILKRIQILVPLFIEGGTIIDLDEPEWSLERWTVFFYYEKEVAEDCNPYTFMGYSTVYRYFHFQAITNKPGSTKQANAEFTLPLDNISFSSLPCRSRISQFVILPPFHGGGYGSRFYKSIFDFYLAEPETVEITVEDPNYAFDDMRDLNDLARLRTLPEFRAIKINTTIKPDPEEVIPNNIVDLPALEKIRKKMKIAPRQFLRVVEMHLLSHIPKSVRKAEVLDETPKMREFALWQLWVKKRLYKHNKDLLSQMEKEERLDKLDEVLAGVVGDYTRLLGAYKTRIEHENVAKLADQGDAGVKDATSSSNGKRRSPTHDDDGADDEGADGGADDGEPLSKRPKV